MHLDSSVVFFLIQASTFALYLNNKLPIFSISYTISSDINFKTRMKRKDPCSPSSDKMFANFFLLNRTKIRNGNCYVLVASLTYENCHLCSFIFMLLWELVTLEVYEF